MKVTSNQKTGANTVELEVAVSAGELKEATDKAFRKKVGTITVPGFRKGKAPRGIIEKMYGDIFMEDAVNDLYPSIYAQAVEEAGIEPVDRADVEMLSLDKETGFTFKATVTVKPEVAIGEYKGIKAEKIVYTVGDGEIMKEIDRMRDRNARIITVEDRATQDGDEVVINFEGFIDGEAFEGGKAEGHKITLGSHSFIDTFEEQICGHNTGDEFDVNVTFPEQYHAEELKGKPALFKVKLCEIKAKELPELDDEFVKDVSEFDTLDEYKADIRTKLQESKDRQAQDSLENTLVDNIIDGLKAEIPECMFEQRIDELVRDFEYRLSSQGMNIDIYLQYAGMDMENFRKGFRDQAERQVKIRLALEKIVELEKIVPTTEDVEAEYEKMAKAYEMEPEKLRGMVPEKELVKDIATNMAIDLVRNSADVTEKAEEKTEETGEVKTGEEVGEDKKSAKKSAKKPAAKKAKKDSETEEESEEGNE